MKNKKGKTADAQLKKRIVKFFIPFVMLLMIIIIGTAAWFTMNKETETGGLGMASVYVPFEVASYGGDGNYDRWIPSYHYPKGDILDDSYDIYAFNRENNIFEKTEEKLLKQNDDGSFWSRITGSHNSVKWQVSSESNFANFNSGADQDDNDNESAQKPEPGSPDDEEKFEYRLEPGDSGYLEFFVIPKKSGNLKLKFTLDIDIFEKDRTPEALIPDSSLKLVPGSEYEFQQQYLRHHILFFREKDEQDSYSRMLGYSEPEEGKQAGNIDFDVSGDYMMTFTDEISDAKTDAAYRYRIYWIWPNILGQVILPDDSQILRNNTADNSVFGNENEKTAFISKMKEHPEYFFNIDAENLSQTTASQVTYDDLKKLAGHFLPVDKGDVQTDGDIDDDYYKLSYYWNRADQYVGFHISFITAEMTVNSNE